MKLAHGKVHLYQKVLMPFIMPLPVLCTGRSEHPLSDHGNQAGFFCKRNKFKRRNKTTLRVLPSYNRLGPDYLIICHRDNRLVINHEIFLLNSTS